MDISVSGMHLLQNGAVRDSLTDGMPQTAPSQKARKNKKKNQSSGRKTDSMYEAEGAEVYLVTKSRPKKIRVDMQTDLACQVDLPYMLEADRNTVQMDNKNGGNKRTARPRRQGEWSHTAWHAVQSHSQ